MHKIVLLGEFASRYRFFFVSLCVLLSGGMFSLLLLLNASYFRLQFVVTSMGEIFVYLIFILLFRFLLKKTTFFLFSTTHYWCNVFCDSVVWVAALLLGVLGAMYTLELIVWREFFRFDYLKLVVTVVGILMISAIPVLLLSYYTIQKKEHQEHTERLELQTRLQLLQSKINPHFLFNSLNSIIHLANKNETTAIKDMVYALSQLYRTVLSTTSTSFLFLGNELDMISHYLAIEKIRFGSRLTYSITCPESLRTIQIPFFIIEIFVENAVLHGIFPRPEGGTVSVVVSRNKGVLEIIVMDNGVGYDPNSFVPKGTGFGIHSVIERLNLIYGSRYTYTVTSVVGQGTTVILEVPCE